MKPLILEDLNLQAAERRLCTEALTTAGNITGAAELLGIDRQALKRRIKKLGIAWPPPRTAAAAAKPELGQ